MAVISRELREKLKKAESPDDVRLVLQENHEDPALAENLWKEIQHFNQELSMEELESITGGADRDYLIDGCAATVEAGSWCRSN